MDRVALSAVVIAAFDLLGGDPAPLDIALASASALKTPGRILTSDLLFGAVGAASANDPVRLHVGQRFVRWDYESNAGWSPGTKPNTQERRIEIYDLLRLSPAHRDICDANFPPFVSAQPLIVIAEKHKLWYTPERRRLQAFYWDAYRDHLRGQGWTDDALANLDDSTTTVVARLADPAQPEVYQSKGLVVGYVQSGKTAHFTGVLAKAADAGYRLVIVLSGTINLLRAQTQRRLDKELIGKELIRRGAPTDTELDYVNDADWQHFLSHGGLPSERGAFDWQRLTGPQNDYLSLRRGIDALEFDSERTDRNKPFFDPTNLYGAKARLMVVKKNATVLKRVAEDLRRIRARLADIPTLLIDDESDQASINTNPVERRRRSAINLRIVDLLQQLPRAQYVGYTATPFANVFIDPDDAADIFPKDFIISLRRPRGYMGVREFHDLDGKPQGLDSNEQAFIRDVRGDDESAENLQRALDSYVLTGALKLFRAASGIDTDTRHHTMLVHTSQLTSEHHSMAERVRRVIRDSRYNAGEGVARLKQLLSSDFAPVSANRAPHLPMPASLDELRPHIGECLARLNNGDDPVLVVNGTDRDSPDFDRTSVWKIILGGAKLSRGYTVEGLTVSYYRRTAGAADALMQMGRWFGFRRNYEDLVRVFIGRAEPFARTEIDLYLAFEAICKDEEAFRTDLLRYALPDDGSEPITPKQVPPLVPSHLTLIAPTSTNKMYNAVVRFENFGGRQTQRTIAPMDEEDRRSNLKHAADLLATVRPREVRLGAVSSDEMNEFHALLCLVDHKTALRFLNSYRWQDRAKLLSRELAFLGGANSDPEIDTWAIVAPLVQQPKEMIELGTIQLPVIRRAQTATNRYNVYTDPEHVAVAEFIAHAAQRRVTLDTASLNAERRGCLLLYAVRGPKEVGLPTIGFAIFYPPNHLPQRLVFGVRDATQPDAIVVPAAGALERA